MHAIEQLLEVMRALRDPQHGCPWDRQQDFQSLIPYTLEEAYEVADAIERNDLPELKSELGDLLFQIVFYAQLADEQQQFNFADIAAAISDKLIRRHPHVFADATFDSAEQQTEAWEAIKQQERADKAGAEPVSCLDGVSRTLPSMMRAEKLQKRAAREGFDWPEITGVLDKVAEELQEVREELAQQPQQPARLEAEIGDLFFSCINLARHAGVDAEQALRKANLKFEQRLRAVEAGARDQGRQLAELDIAEMEALWQQAKQAE